MLRNLALAFLGLSVLAGPVSARGDGSGDDRRAGAKAASAKADGRGALRRVAFTRAVSPGPAACVRTARPSVMRCRSAASSVVSRSWAQGLPPALGVQAQECPAGTMATLAEGHDDIVRCIPI